MRLGIRYKRAPLRIIGKEKQALAGFVEPSDGSEPSQVLRKQGINGIAAFFIRRGSDNAVRLVHHQIDFLGGSDSAPLHLNSISSQAHRSFWIPGSGAI